MDSEGEEEEEETHVLSDDEESPLNVEMRNSVSVKLKVTDQSSPEIIMPVDSDDSYEKYLDSITKGANAQIDS